MITKYYETLVYNLIKPYFENKYGNGIIRKRTINGTARIEGEECSYQKEEEFLQPLRELILMCLIYDIYPHISNNYW